MPDQLEFWFQYGSTYSYLSVMRAGSTAAAAGVALVWKPFLLAPLFIKAGLPDGPFLPYPAKTRYMWRDLERRAKLRGLSYRRPSVYPPNTLLTARVGLVAATEGWCEPFTKAVFRRHWTEDLIIGTTENLRASIAELGREPDIVIGQAQTPENKAQLRGQTEEVERRGLFGSPSFLVRDEIFWATTDWRTRSRMRLGSSRSPTPRRAPLLTVAA
jgi:2-hydroxychromene-2-carboxylate isomerase